MPLAAWFCQGRREKKEVAMKFLFAVLFIRFIAALFEKNDAVTLNMQDNVQDGDGLHPAEFETRDHFTVRCAE